MRRLMGGLIAGIFCLLHNPLSASGVYPTVTFLRLVNSPRAVGLGKCSITLVDEQSSLYNPGALGLFHLDKIAGFSSPSSTDWLPETDIDATYKTWCVSGGLSYRLFRPHGEKGINASLAMARSHQRFNYGTLATTTERGDTLGYSYPYDETDNYSIGLGFELDRVGRLGLGYTHKEIYTDLDMLYTSGDNREGSATDFGVILEILPLELLSIQAHKEPLERRGMYYKLEQSVAYVLANVGDDIKYAWDSRLQPLPKSRRIGVSTYLAVYRREAILFSGRLVGEIEKDLVWEKAKNIYKGGVELGFLDIVFIRGGWVNRVQSDLHYTTLGFGVSLNGAVVWLGQMEKLRLPDNFWGRLVRNLNVSYDFAVLRDNDEDNLFRNTKSFKFSASL